ncbi:MAG: type II secretion system protein GspN [Myxococcales bacterium]|nr:type II secretion system protein GspN [Myxococcales bacterium]
MAFAFPHLGRKTKLALKIVGFFLLAVVTFVFALQLTFPYDRVKDRLVEALSTKYDVQIGDVERGIVPGRVYFKAVTLRTRPAKAEEVPSVLYIEKLEVDMGILALLSSTAKVNIDAKIATGHIKGSISLSKKRTVVDISGIDVPAGNLPMKEIIGLPMSGKLELEFSLDLPIDKLKSGRTGPDWTAAKGDITFECPSGCTFGDGKTKLKPKLNNARNQAFAGEGIEFGKINVDSMLAHVKIADGQLELDKFDTKSQDGELHVDFALTLAQDFGESDVAGCLRFKGSDGLQKREPKTYAALTTTGASIGPDNLFHIRLDGKFKTMKRLAQFCGPAVKSANMDNPGGAAGNSRPSITVQPADESLRGGSAAPVNPPPPAAPTPAPATPTPSPPTTPSNTETPPTPMTGSASGSAAFQPPPNAEAQPVPEGSGTAGAGGAGTDQPPIR